MLRIAAILGVVAVTGGAVGVALEQAGTVDVVAEHRIPATLDAVPYSPCPGEEGFGDLHRGDRVYLTGRTEDGSWLELRAPYEVADRVWIESVWVFADGTVDRLPIVECAGSAAVPAGSQDEVLPTTIADDTEDAASSAGTAPMDTTTSTTTIPPAATAPATTAATTTVPAPTTTVPAPTTSTVPATTTTTTAPDSTGPSIDLLAAQPSEIWEDANFGGCPTQPHTATISVTVADPSGIARVVLGYDTGRGATTVEMSAAGGGSYAATVGPFAGDQVDADSPVDLTVSATDTRGNTSVQSDDAALTLHNCTIG